MDCGRKEDNRKVGFSVYILINLIINVGVCFGNKMNCLNLPDFQRISLSNNYSFSTYY